MRKEWYCYLSFTILIALVGCSTGMGTQDEPVPVEVQQVPELESRIDHTVGDRSPFTSRPWIVSRSNTGHGTNTRTDNVDFYEYYYGNTNKQISEKLKQLNEVEDAHVYIQGRVILIGVLATEEWDKKLEKKVREAAFSQLGNNQADVRVIHDNENFSEFQRQVLNIRENVPYEEGVDAENFMQDFGRIFQRPFERNKVRD
ncbi:YhcN/YlaJ family sporulation lipoprotein [Alkalihalobacillus sp. BA299]|uniref:YhcN/YlaJ family sporulation lipoprotein n=1 Tax=Alkalihalobacillus sp. BA299 TaxID=2815938 RepID=UPI001ADD3DE3|nr:YhcN/YlaJ family sporulation lipoprotein [Alkalihalobacillus sp. BA299]